MRKLVLLALLFAAACGGDPASRLIGTWILDFDSFKKLDFYKSMSDEEKAQAEGFMGMLKMEITFTDDTLIFEGSTLGKKSTEKLSYSVVSTDGDKMKIETVSEKGEKQTVDAHFEDDLLIITKDDMPLALKRKS